MTLPAALAGLTEVPQGLVPEGNTYCLFHGKQIGFSCPECDQHFPDQVAARAIGTNAQAGVVGYSKAEIDKLVAAAVKTALAERQAFEDWKASTEGQAAAAVAATAGQTPPEHGA